jgi:hypothetical protein
VQRGALITFVKARYPFQQTHVSIKHSGKKRKVWIWQTTPGSLQRTSISSSVPSALPTSEGGREGEGGGKRETERERKRQRKRLRYRGRVNQKRVRIEKACISEFFCTHHLFLNKSSKKCILLIFFSVLYGWRLVSGCFPLSRYTLGMHRSAFFTSDTDSDI